MAFPPRNTYERFIYSPAPGISFTEPNLPTLIADCIALGAGLADEPPAESDQEPQP